jgi:hypothetical protein
MADGEENTEGGLLCGVLGVGETNDVMDKLD